MPKKKIQKKKAGKKVKQTDEDKIAILELGKDTDFWELIKNSLDEEIESIEEENKNKDRSELSAERYKFESEMFKFKKEFFEILKTRPEDMISWLIPHEEKEPENDDPYDKV